MERPRQIEINYAHDEVRSNWPADVGYVGLKLIGLWNILQAMGTLVLSFAALTGLMRSAAVSSSSLAYLVWVAWPLVVGLSLTLFARPIADFLFARPAASPPTFDTAGVVMLMTVGIGIWLVATHFPGLLYDGYHFLRELGGESAPTPPATSGLPRTPERLIYSLAEVIVGSVFFLRPRWVVGLFQRNSHAGRRVNRL